MFIILAILSAFLLPVVAIYSYWFVVDARLGNLLSDAPGLWLLLIAGLVVSAAGVYGAVQEEDWSVKAMETGAFLLGGLLLALYFPINTYVEAGFGVQLRIGAILAFAFVLIAALLGWYLSRR